VKTGIRHQAVGNSKKTKVIGLALCAILFVLCVPASAPAQPKKTARIGYLGSTAATSAADMKLFRMRLTELGYIEGQNIAIEYRAFDGKVERLQDLATEFIRLNPDVIVSVGNEATLALKNATTNIPIVMVSTSDAVQRGFVASLARSGGNVTGLTSTGPDINGKRLELLKEILPKLSRVAVFMSSSGVDYAQVLKELDIAAGAMGMKLQHMDIQVATDFTNAFRSAAEGHAEAALVRVSAPILDPQRKQFAELAVKNRLPVMYERAEEVKAGGLISYGVSNADLYRRAATYVDKILKGTKPAELPVEQPTKFEFIINLKTAKQIGLTIPPNILARADRVIR
jgi:putative ABC transport system substrate-binding protein